MVTHRNATIYLINPDQREFWSFQKMNFVEKILTDILKLNLLTLQ